MTTTDSILIRAPRERVFALAAAVEEWPRILPHSRSVTVLEGDQRRRLVAMHCVRPFGALNFPCRWRATQELAPDEGSIRFTHVAGPTRGMEVEWKLEETPEGVRTSIHHELASRIPLYAEGIVGPVFIRNIAGRTLATIKAIAEREVAA